MPPASASAFLDILLQLVEPCPVDGLDGGNGCLVVQLGRESTDVCRLSPWPRLAALPFLDLLPLLLLLPLARVVVRRSGGAGGGRNQRRS